MHCPHRTILVLKLTLVVDQDKNAYVVLSAAIALRSLSPVQLLQRHHKVSDHTGVIGVDHSLTLTCRNSPWW